MVKNSHIDKRLAKSLNDLSSDEFLTNLAHHLEETCSTCRQPTIKELDSTTRIKTRHLSVAEIETFLGEEPASFAWKMILHAVAVCPTCGTRAGEFLELFNTGLVPQDFSISSLDIALGRSRRDARLLFTRLSELSLEESELSITNDSRFHSWGLAEALCEKSRQMASTAPSRSLHFAKLSLQVSKLVVFPALPPNCKQELVMLAFSHLGNALRVLERLSAAKRAFSQAEKCWSSCNVHYFPYRPSVLSLRASLEIDRREFLEALESTAEAAELMETNSSPDPALRTRVLLKRASALRELGHFQEAGSTLNRAAIVSWELPDRRLWFIARHNQLDLLTKLEQYEAAQLLAVEVAQISRRLGTKADRARVSWVRSRIARHSGLFAEAEMRLKSAKNDFLGAHQGYRAAIVSLELATVYFEQGKLKKVQALALEMLPVFEALEIHREALAALTLFKQAAIKEQLTEQLLKELVGYFHQTQANPQLAFNRSSMPSPD